MKKYVNNSFINKSPSEYKNGTEAVTSLPVEIFTDGQPVSSYTIKGNTTTSGTPSPQNPVTISGVGNETANLYNEANLLEGYYGSTADTYTQLTSNSNFKSFTMQLEAGTYTASISCNEGITLIRASNSIDGVNVVNINDTPYTFTLTGTASIYFSFRNLDSTSTFTNLKIMLNTGSTAQSYEPFGFKISILKDLQPLTPIYLGEVQTTRKIKKYVFTGQEADLRIAAAITSTTAIQAPTTMSDYKREPFICSHMQVSNSSSGSSTHGYYGQYLTLCFALSMGLDTLDNARTYLQQQYANGTPVTVWYVLDTPQTAVVNEPLMEIGDYADSIDSTQAVVTIPTTGGTATIDVDTTVKPSEVDLTYHGWHEHEPLKRENGAWV